jgi:hypothetical protein
MVERRNSMTEKIIGLGETPMSTAELEEMVDGLSAHQREHLHATMSFLVKCYRSKQPYSGVLLVKNTNEKVALVALNADEEEAVYLMTRAMNMLIDAQEEVPPKDQLN